MDIGYSPVRIANGRTGYLGDVNNDYYYKNISKKLIGTNTSGYDDNNNFQRFLDEYDFLESDGGFDQTGAWQKNIKNGLYLLPHEILFQVKQLITLFLLHITKLCKRLYLAINFRPTILHGSAQRLVIIISIIQVCMVSLLMRLMIMVLPIQKTHHLALLLLYLI